MRNRLLVMLCIFSLAYGCSKSPEQNNLMLTVPLESFGEKEISTVFTMNESEGEAIELKFKGDESYSFHSGYQIIVHAEGSVQGKVSAVDGIFAGNGEVEIRMTIRDPVQHERVVYEKYPILVDGTLKDGNLVGTIVKAE